jgi:mRNA interferase MazF
VSSLRRGQVVRADIGLSEPKLFVVVSNNSRNRHFDQVLAARMTTSVKKERPSIVELGSDEAFTGRVVCDDIETIWEDEVLAVVGGLTPTTMHAVDGGLQAALGFEH